MMTSQSSIFVSRTPVNAGSGRSSVDFDLSLQYFTPGTVLCIAPLWESPHRSSEAGAIYFSGGRTVQDFPKAIARG